MLKSLILARIHRRRVGCGEKLKSFVAKLFVGRSLSAKLLGEMLLLAKVLAAGRTITLKVKAVLTVITIPEGEDEDMIAVDSVVEVAGVSEVVDMGDIDGVIDFDDMIDVEEECVTLAAVAVTVMNLVKVVTTSGMEAVLSSEE